MKLNAAAVLGNVYDLDQPGLAIARSAARQALDGCPVEFERDVITPDRDQFIRLWSATRWRVFVRTDGLLDVRMVTVGFGLTQWGARRALARHLRRGKDLLV